MSHNLHNRYMNTSNENEYIGKTPNREESDREDIMREATALKRRVSLRVADLPEPIVAGFRSNNYFSVFFDQDPVYQFDNHGRLRRAYRNGLLFRTQGTTLAKLDRVRIPGKTILEREDLGEEELAKFFTEMHAYLAQLLTALEDGTAVVVETVPPDAEVVASTLAALRDVLASAEPLAPALPTRR